MIVVGDGAEKMLLCHLLSKRELSSWLFFFHITALNVVSLWTEAKFLDWQGVFKLSCDVLIERHSGRICSAQCSHEIYLNKPTYKGGEEYRRQERPLSHLSIERRMKSKQFKWKSFHQFESKHKIDWRSKKVHRKEFCVSNETFTHINDTAD